MHKNPIRYLKQLVTKAARLLPRWGEADTPAVDERFIDGHFTHRFGTRDYKLYLPPTTTGQQRERGEAAVLGETYPERFAAVGRHSGVPTGLASDLFKAMAVMKSGPAGATASSVTPPPAGRTVERAGCWPCVVRGQRSPQGAVQV